MRFVHHLLLVTVVFFHQHHHHKPKPNPEPVIQAPAHDAYWALAQCESGGDAATNTGNGFYGAFQFDLTTWHSLGRVGVPSDYSYAYQKEAAEELYNQRGSQPWPVCGSVL